jgi:hypothetical protein
MRRFDETKIQEDSRFVATDTRVRAVFLCNVDLA